MDPSTDASYRVVEMERTRGQGLGEVILFGLIAPTAPKPCPIFCLCFQKSGWEFFMDPHYDAATINAVASNGANMGLRDLIKLAKAHARTKYPDG